MKKLTKEQRKKFAPLQDHEDFERAKYFSIGAGFVIIAWILSLL
jgi:hypothetical protein